MSSSTCYRQVCVCKNWHSSLMFRLITYCHLWWHLWLCTCVMTDGVHHHPIQRDRHVHLVIHWWHSAAAGRPHRQDTDHAWLTLHSALWGRDEVRSYLFFYFNMWEGGGGCCLVVMMRTINVCWSAGAFLCVLETWNDVCVSEGGNNLLFDQKVEASCVS